MKNIKRNRRSTHRMRWRTRFARKNESIRGGPIVKISNEWKRRKRYCMKWLISICPFINIIYEKPKKSEMRAWKHFARNRKIINQKSMLHYNENRALIYRNYPVSEASKKKTKSEIKISTSNFYFVIVMWGEKYIERQYFNFLTSNNKMLFMK